MKNIFTAILLLIVSSAYSQQAPDSVADHAKVFNYVEVMPEFPGGQTAMMKFISKNLRYPPAAREQGIEGRVVAQFIVDYQGYISDIQILRDIGGGCGDEVVRVIKSMPRWKPAMQSGSPVSVYFKLPVTFALGTDDGPVLPENSDAGYFGGEEAFQAYAAKHLKYPKEARKNHISGVLLVTVDIDERGRLFRINFDNTLGFGCEAAASDMLHSVTLWTPARVNGQYHSGSVKLKITFPPE